MAGKIGILAVSVSIMLLSGSTAIALASNIIWNNGDYAVPIYGRYVDNYDGIASESADDFFLDAGTIINDVHFTAAYYSSYDGGDIQWALYNDDSSGLFSHPGATVATGLAVNTQILPIAGTDLDIFNVWFDLDSPVTWGGGAGWLGLFMPGEDGDVSWLGTSSHYGSDSLTRYDSGLWEQDRYSYDLAFKLSTIPEPSTILLLGTGLVGVVGLARRRKS